MAVISGCQEGKATPKPQEVKCPQCGADMEVFVRMGGEIGYTGTLAADETCDACGFVAKQGTPASELASE